MLGRLKAIAPPPVKAAGRRLLSRVPRRPRPAILMYHRIGHETFDPWGLVVEQQRFADQLQWLAHHRTVLALSDFAERHREGRLDEDAIAITFDDGYAAAIRSAIPLLHKLRLKATVFLPVALVERGREFWWDELQRIVLGFQGDMLRIGGADVRVPPPDRNDSLWHPSARPSTPRQMLFLSLHAKLRSSVPSEIDRLMAELREQAQLAQAAADRPLTADELRAIRTSEIEFGSHALTHPSLPKLGEADKAREIGDSRVRCAALTGETPASFAYPYGDFDRPSMRLAEQAGFACAVTADHGFVDTGTDCYALPRLRVGNWTHSGLRGLLNA